MDLTSPSALATSSTETDVCAPAARGTSVRTRSGTSAVRMVISFRRLSPDESDLPEIAQRTRMNRVRSRCGSHGVRGRGLARLSETLTECGLTAMERAGQTIGDVVGKVRSGEDEAPRSDRDDRRVLSRIGVCRRRQRLEEPVLRLDALDLLGVGNNEPRAPGILGHRHEARPPDAATPQRRDTAVEHHLRTVAGLIEEDGLEIAIHV